jgi:hypothetical protein
MSQPDLAQLLEEMNAAMKETAQARAEHSAALSLVDQGRVIEGQAGWRAHTAYLRERRAIEAYAQAVANQSTQP